MDLNSLADDVLSLLSAESSAVQSSTVASSEYKLRATVGSHVAIILCSEMREFFFFNIVR